MIGAWAVAIGVLEIIGAIWLRKEIEDEWLLIATGIISVLFGLAILLRPGVGALALAWAVGAFALLSGLLHVAFAFASGRQAPAAARAGGHAGSRLNLPAPSGARHRSAQSRDRGGHRRAVLDRKRRKMRVGCQVAGCSWL